MAEDHERAEPSEEASGLFGGRVERDDLVTSTDWGTRTRCLAYALAVLLGAIVLGSLLTSVGAALLAGIDVTEADSPVVYYASTTALSLAGFLIVAGGYLAVGEDWSLIRARRLTRRDAVWIALGTVVFFVVMGIGTAIVSLLDLETAENIAVERGQENPELFLVFLPIQFLLTAPAEEVLFRGVIQGLLRRAYGVLPGIILASLLFGLIHYPALAGSDGVLTVITLLVATGALLGALYEYTGNLLVPIVVHALWNVFVFGSEYLSAVGGV
ncbi:MAG: type II CAAX endopeptidase family protein [Halovenus sp.]